MRRVPLTLMNGITPGRTGLVQPEVGQLVDHAPVVVDLEEELGDAEVDRVELRREVPPVGRAVGRAGMELREGRGRDGEVADLADQVDQLGRVR